MNAEAGPPEAVAAQTGREGSDRGVLLGDRLCVACGFNLHGQTIAREPHYGMLSVRCPECSTMASLQEYPVLGAWARRMGMVLALVWAVAMLLLAFFTGLTVYFGATGVAVEATRPAARQIGLAFKEYVLAHDELTASGTPYSSEFAWMVQQPDPELNYVDEGWFTQQTMSTLASRPPIGPRLLVHAIPFALGMAAWGAAWSVASMHRRVGRRLLAPVVVCCLAGAMLVLAHLRPATSQSGFGTYVMQGWGWGIPASMAAERAFGLPAALLGLGLGVCSLAVGVVLGRPLARLAARLLLPPHQRGPLAGLWHVDGLPSPPTRGEFWLRG